MVKKKTESGIQVEQGLFISHVCPGGVVAKYGVLPCVGDRIISVSSLFFDRTIEVWCNKHSCCLSISCILFM